MLDYLNLTSLNLTSINEYKLLADIFTEENNFLISECYFLHQKNK